MQSHKTARYAIPLLASGQAQKELFHNEAITMVDFLLQPAVQSVHEDPETLSPNEGESWLIGSTPVGDWADFANHIAGWCAGGWRYFEPQEAMIIFLLDSGANARFLGGSWQFSDQVPTPTGGSVVDVEARQAVDSLISSLQSFGILAV